jgi:hypothetical protein
MTVIKRAMLLILSCTKVLATPPAISFSKQRRSSQFFNLRGQRLFLNGVKQGNSIVLERVMGSIGNMSVRKRMNVPK